MQKQHRVHPVSDSRFVELLAKHEPEIRAYIRVSLPSPHDVAEVMQNVSLVAWRKFAELENAESDFARWTCVIARYEIMKFKRGLARDRFVLQNDVVETLCEEGETETALRAQQIQLLERCLEQLPKDRREFVMEAYSPGVTMRELARRRGRKPDALYQLMRRIRLKLEACVSRRLEKLGEARA